MTQRLVKVAIVGRMSPSSHSQFVKVAIVGRIIVFFSHFSCSSTSYIFKFIYSHHISHLINIIFLYLSYKLRRKSVGAGYQNSTHDSWFGLLHPHDWKYVCDLCKPPSWVNSVRFRPSFGAQACVPAAKDVEKEHANEGLSDEYGCSRCCRNRYPEPLPGIMGSCSSVQPDNPNLLAGKCKTW